MRGCYWDLARAAGVASQARRSLPLLAGLETVQLVEACGQQPPQLGAGVGVEVAPYERWVLVAEFLQRLAGVVQNQASPFCDFQRRTIPRPGSSWPMTASSSRRRVLSSMPADARKPGL